MADRDMEYGESHEDREESLPYTLILNHKRLIFWVCFSSMFAALLILMQMADLYSAETTILLNSNPSQGVELETNPDRAYRDDSYKIRTEMQVISSPTLAARVVKKAGLDKVQEFKAGAKADSILAKILGLALPQEWTETFMGSLASGTDTGATGESDEMAAAMELFKRRLKVKQASKSMAVSIEFTSKDPKLAAKISDMMAEEYISSLLELKLETAQKANEWLKIRLVELRNKLEASENEISEFIRKNSLYEFGGKTMDSQQLSEVNSQLILAKSELAQAEAKYHHVHGLFSRGDTREMVSAEEVLSSPVVQRLRMQEAELGAKISELSQDFGEKHPMMINTRAQYDDIKREIRNEVGNIVDSLKSNLMVAQVKVSSLQTELNKTVSSSGEETEAKIKLKALEREVNANRAIYENFLSQFKKTNEQQNLEQSDIRILAHAEVPSSPSFPNRKLILILVFIGSLFAGSAAAYILEIRGVKSGFMSAQQIKVEMGVMVLGAVPDLVSLDIDEISPEECILDHPFSPYSEAIRSIATALYMQCMEKERKIFMITSALPMEGKTALSISLARSCAMDNHKVLHVDFDMRRPTAGKRLRTRQQNGILDILEKRKSIKECLVEDKSGAHFIISGAQRLNYPVALKTKEISAILSQAREYYDIIFLDSAPVLPVRDSRSLAQCVDAVIFLVKWKSTKKQDALTALEMLREHNGKIAGVALTGLDIRENMKYGYRGASYYYGSSYNKYYGGY